MAIADLQRENVKIIDDDAQTILADVIADYEKRTGKTLQPAHIERLLINTFAYRMALNNQKVNEAYRQQHVRFATGLMLDLCGDDVNTPRLEASAARCTLRFSGEEFSGEVNIPIGTLVSVNDVIFSTLTTAQLTAANPSADIQAACTQTGTRGNDWAIGQINTLQTSLSDAVKITVKNITTPTGGADSESDDAYRERILLAFESFSVAGSVGAYEYFAREVSPSIVDVNVDNETDKDGNPIGGTVAVTILTQTGMPSEELLAQVRSALSGEKIRPLCDTVIVKAPTVLNYELNAQLILKTGANAVEVKAAAQAAFNAWETAKRAKLGGDIVPLDVSGCLKVAGVYNVILNSPNLLVVKPNQWARCTAINLTISAEQQDG